MLVFPMHLFSVFSDIYIYVYPFPKAVHLGLLCNWVCHAAQIQAPQLFLPFFSCPELVTSHFTLILLQFKAFPIFLPNTPAVPFTTQLLGAFTETLSLLTLANSDPESQILQSYFDVLFDQFRSFKFPFN